MTDLEIAINMLAEATTTELSKQENPQGFSQSAGIAHRWGKAAHGARQVIEQELGHSIVSPENARTIASGERAVGIAESSEDQE